MQDRGVSKTPGLTVTPWFRRRDWVVISRLS